MRLSGPFKTWLFVGVLLVALIQLGLMIRNVTIQVDKLSDSRSDSQIWMLSQIEVDYQKLKAALSVSASGVSEATVSPRELRSRFDIFYSRIRTVTEGDSYRVLKSDPAFSSSLKGIAEYLSMSLMYVDASDETFLSAVPTLAIATQDIENDVRQLALLGLGDTAFKTELLRTETRSVLTQMFVSTVVLITGLVSLILILRQMTRRARKASEKNRLSRARIATMIETALDAILVTNARGHILEMNQAAETMFGFKLAHQPARHLNKVIRRSDTQAAFKMPANSGLVGRGRLQATGLRANGDAFEAEISLIQTVTEDGDEIYVAYIRDISARLKAQADLMQARDDAQLGEQAKSRLLAVMSHEIRTPLNGVLGAADLLQSTLLDNQQQRYVKAMQTSGDVLMRHVNDVLEMSRLDAEGLTKDVQPLDLRNVVGALIESQQAAAQQAGNTLEMRISVDVPNLVMGDLQGVQQALLNLIGNALKFTTDGKVMVEVDVFGAADLIDFSVADTGPGISEANLNKVFDEFYAADASLARPQQGTGLGLAITRRIVDAMGGTISVESLPGEGSLFSFRIPMPAHSLENPKASTREKTASIGPALQVLLVEDNDINRMITRDMLRNAGHHVTEAIDGVAGVTQAGKAAFDLILMDLSMPGLDGLSASSMIRESEGPSKDAPIVALTAQVIAPDAPSVTQSGITDVLQKPLSSEGLNRMIRRVVSRGEKFMRLPDEVAKANPLREDILTDVITNIGVQNVRLHNETLCADIAPLLKTCRSGHALSQPDQELAHKLAGAAAVLGLCGLHRSLSALENLPANAAPAERQSAMAHTLATWEHSQTALLAYLKPFEDTKLA